MNVFTLKNLVVVLFAVFSLQLSAQSKLDLKKELPVDPDVVIGTLDNGMKYYIRHNAKPEKRAYFDIVTRVGSTSEDDDQRGFAHFCEHMSFNGTKNFPGKGIIEYFESIGMAFGRNINAYTSYDRTVYELKALPTTNEEYIDKALLTLHDWASANTDSDEEINAERGVIHEEYRSRYDVNGRLRAQFFPYLLFGSKYPLREVIGTYEIIDYGTPEALRRFRKTWYRPDLQAVIIVGDIDVKKMEKKVKALFSKIPKAVNPRKRAIAEIPTHKQTLVSIATDKEKTDNSVSVYYKRPHKAAKTVEDYRNDIIISLYNSMLNYRLSIKAQEADCPYLGAQVGDTYFLGELACYYIGAGSKNGKVRETLAAVLRESERAKKFGFTKVELDRTLKQYKSSIDNYYKERNNRKSASFIKEYIKNFALENACIPGIEAENKYYQAFLKDITLDEIQAAIKNYITDENIVISIQAPEKELANLPTEPEVLKIFNDVKNEKLEAHIEKEISKKLIKKAPRKGKIVKKEKVKAIKGLTKWTLSNGVEVYLYPTKYKEDEISMTAYSYGGTSLYKNNDLLSAQWANQVVANGGLGDFNPIELGKVLAGNTASVSTSIDGMSEGLSGSSNMKDFETLMKLTYLKFTAPRSDKARYDILLNKSKEGLKNKYLNPMASWQDTISATMANYNPRIKPMKLERLSELDYKKMHKIYKERFANAADFKFVFVGNIDLKKVKPLICKYLGGLKGNPKKKEKFVDHNISPAKGVIKKYTYGCKEQKATVLLNFISDIDYNLKNRIAASAMGKALSNALLLNIREKLGGVYGIGARPNITKYPKEKISCMIQFVCSPDRVEELKKAVFSEIENIKKNGTSAEYFKKVITQIKRSKETSVKKNGYWLSVIKSYLFNNTNFKEVNQYDKVLNKLTNADIKNIAKKVFDTKNFQNFVFMPENMKK